MTAEALGVLRQLIKALEAFNSPDAVIVECTVTTIFTLKINNGNVSEQFLSYLFKHLGDSAYPSSLAASWVVDSGLL